MAITSAPHPEATRYNRKTANYLSRQLNNVYAPAMTFTPELAPETHGFVTEMWYVVKVTGLKDQLGEQVEGERWLKSVD